MSIGWPNGDRQPGISRPFRRESQCGLVRRPDSRQPYQTVPESVRRGLAELRPVLALCETYVAIDDVIRHLRAASRPLRSLAD
jgi:hypothetical protein